MKRAVDFMFMGTLQKYNFPYRMIEFNQFLFLLSILKFKGIFDDSLKPQGLKRDVLKEEDTNHSKKRKF